MLPELVYMFRDWTLAGLMAVFCMAVWVFVLFAAGFALFWTVALIQYAIQCVTGVRDKDGAQKNEGYDGW